MGALRQRLPKNHHRAEGGVCEGRSPTEAGARQEAGREKAALDLQATQLAGAFRQFRVPLPHFSELADPLLEPLNVGKGFECLIDVAAMVHLAARQNVAQCLVGQVETGGSVF